MAGQGSSNADEEPLATLEPPQPPLALSLASAFAVRAATEESKAEQASGDMPVAQAPAAATHDAVAEKAKKVEKAKNVPACNAVAPPASTPEMSTSLMVPVSGGDNAQRSAMVVAVEQTREAERERSYAARLGGLRAGEQIALRCRTSDRTAGLTRTDDGFLLVEPGRAVQTLKTVEEAAALTSRFVVPAPTKEQLSDAEATAVRKREAREAKHAREAERRAAVEAATQQWYEQQAELAAELGIGFEDWQRIVTLLSKPPPTRVGNSIVLNSVAAGEAMVIDAAIESAIAAPLHDSLRAAAERTAAAGEGGKRKKEAGIEQSVFGADVTVMAEAMGLRDAENEKKRQKKEEENKEKAASAAAKQKASVHKACSKLLEKKGKVADVAISDLLILIKWQRATPPTNTSAANKANMVKVWEDLKVSQGELQAQAALHAAAPAAAKKSGAPKAATRKKKAEDSSDEEDDEEDDNADSEDDNCEGEDEEDEDEHDAAAIHAQKGKGKGKNGLKYHVEWEGWEEWTWEPAANLEGSIALENWLDGGRKAWEAARKPN